MRPARRKRHVGGVVTVDVYEVVTRAVEDGISIGITRAHKHTDKPTREGLADAVYSAVMAELCGVLKFGGGE